MADIQEKIRKLLALADSPNEHEAQLAMLKAQELLLKYKLSEADVWDAAKLKTKDIRTGITCSKRRDPWIAELAATVAKNYCCQGYRVHTSGKQTQGIGFIGLEEDAEVCAAVFRYAVDCVQAEIGKMRKDYDNFNAALLKQLCDSYSYGFCAGVNMAFQAQTEANKDTWGLVLVMAQEVKDAAKDMGHKPFHAIHGDQMLQAGYDWGVQDGKQFAPQRTLKENPGGFPDR